MAKNLVQMSINGVLYDIRDQRMTTKLDYIHTSLTQALEHKQDLATAVVTDNDSVNWIGRLTSGSTSSVTRYKDDYIDTITGPADTHIHSLWFSMGPISYDPADKDNKELEQLRAWSKSFGVEFQELTKRPRILGLDDKDQRAEVNIYGKSLHTEYIDSPLGINYIHPDKVEAINHDITGLPQSIPELECLQWLYYGKRDNETNTTPLLENINIIGNASAITNIALWDFFQKEDNSYYRVLSEERIANKQIDKNLATQNAYKIVTLDENGIIPDIFLGELKSNPLNIGNVWLIDDNSQLIIKNDNVTGDNFVIAIQPSATDTDTTKLTQTTINTKDITANNITVSDTITTNTLEVNEDASVTGKVSANSAEITNGLSAGSATVKGEVSAGSAKVTNELSAGSISTKGAVSANSASITGAVSANSAEITSISASNIQITNKAGIQTLDVKGDATVTGTLSATYLDAALDLSARNATFSKDIQAKNATITAKTATNTLEVKDSATITGELSAGNISTEGALSAGSISTEGALSAGSATIANLITDTAVSSTKAVGYDDTGKLIPIDGVADNATNITSILTGLSTVDTDASSIYYKLMKLIYPVGSLYWSSKSTNPAALFGGTWVQIKDRFVLACGDTYKTVDETGGESSVTLSVDNMPSHTHSFTPSGSVSSHSHSFTPSGDVNLKLNNSTHTGSFTLRSYHDKDGSYDHNTDYYADASGVFSLISSDTIGYEIPTPFNNIMFGFAYDTVSFSLTTNVSGSTTFVGTSGTTGSTTPTFTGNSGTTSSNGSGTSFSILPPYVVKYCFERTA